MFSGNYYDSRLLWFFLGLAAIEARRGQDVAGRARQRHSNDKGSPADVCAVSRDRLQGSSILRI
jgi:hypothetical protein